jgi:PAS domain S-box-containing protein
MAEAPPYRRIVEESVAFAMFCIDLSGTITSWNRAATNMFGLTAGDVIGRPASLVFTPEDLATGAFDREFEIAAREGRADDDRWHIRADGTRFWANGLLTALRDEAGVLEFFVKMVRDETPERRAFESIKTAEEQFARLFFGNPAAIIVERATSHEIVFANDVFFRLTEYWRAELMGRTGDELHIWARPEERERLLSRPSSSGVSTPTTLRTKSGRRLSCLAVAAEVLLNSEPCIVITALQEPSSDFARE